VLSCHTCTSFCNNSDIIENLKVIKIPYSNSSSLDSIDWKTGAAKIVDCIIDDSYLDMLKQNREQSRTYSPRFAGQKYSDLFDQLGK